MGMKLATSQKATEIKAIEVQWGFHLSKFCRFSLYCEITLCFQNLTLFSYYFLGQSVLPLYCTEVQPCYLENTEQLLKSFSCIISFFGCQMHSYRREERLLCGSDMAGRVQWYGIYFSLLPLAFCLGFTLTLVLFRLGLKQGFCCPPFFQVPIKWTKQMNKQMNK